MKYNLGDFVRFVDERIEGYVTRIIDNEMIGVTGQDDFEIPVPASKVTRVYGHATAEDNEARKPAPLTATGLFKDKGIYLAVVPDHKTAAVIHFYLVNETSYQLLLTLNSQQQQQYKGEFAGVVKPSAHERIYSAPLADLQIWPQFNLQILYYTTQNHKQQLQPLIVTEKFKAKDFAGQQKNVPQLDKPGWTIRLDEDDLIIDAAKLKESLFKPTEEKQQIEKPQTEVDLHIEKLRDDYQFLNSSVILNIQLEKFKKTLDAAIVHQLHEIIFIHGAGNGTLRHELQKLLSKNNKIQTFMDARKEKFGYGATKVLIK